MVTVPRSLHHLDGKYRVLAQLGQGGTADVFLAISRGPNGFSKLVVLKAMRSTLRYEREFTEMFLNEARLSARLNHPNVVQTNEVFEFDGLPVIVMEYLDGQPLSHVLARAGSQTPPPLRLQLHILSEVLAGLHYSHGLTDFDGTPLHVVHRDVSPHNVFVTFDGQAKVLDFGIAKLANSQVETATGIIKGKLRYMPPEQLGGELVDLRADLFSVGVILWEAVAGEKMWSGLTEIQVMKAIGEGSIPDVRTKRPDAPAELCGILARALAAAPHDRYASAREFKQAIDAYLAGSGPPVESEEIEALMARLFSDVRAETRELIEIQMAHVEALSPGELSAMTPLELLHGTTSQGLASSRLNRFSSPTERSSLPFLLLALAAFALLGAALIAWPRLPANAVTAQASATSPAPSSSAEPAPSTTPAPASVRLRITAFPKEAALELDGQALQSNPFVGTFQQDITRVHTIVARARGFEETRQTFTLAEERDVVLALRAQRSGSRSGSRPATAAAAPTPAVDCDPPYSIDPRGVKKFKPECL